MAADGDGLRAVLARLEAAGEPVIYVDLPLDPRHEIARHYLDTFATSPATSRPGPEPCVLYTRAGRGLPVLMGLFGDRRRNRALLGGGTGSTAAFLGGHLDARLAPVRVNAAAAHAHRLEDGLYGLPVLTLTPLDAGPYITSGLVMARDPLTGRPNVSIHRMRVIDRERLTIWMLPGRDLDRIHRAALAAGTPLEVSINIGIDPVVALTSSVTAPFLAAGESELDWAGAIAGAPVAIAACRTHGGLCLAGSEIVIEGRIGAATAPEAEPGGAGFSLPEFLGYMGRAQPSLPVVEVSGVFHRPDALYQTLLGPGKEQSELLAIPIEAGLFRTVGAAFADDFALLEVRLMAAAGGLLCAVARIDKRRERPGMAREVLARVRADHPFTKLVLLVDADVDPWSDEDLFWALTTRFQPSRDLHVSGGARGFPLDPSQAAGYLGGEGPLTDLGVLDLTVPLDQRPRFTRLAALMARGKASA